MVSVLLLLAACTESTVKSSDRPPEVQIIGPLDDATFDPSVPVSLCVQIDDEDSLEELSILVQSSIDGTLWQTGDSEIAGCDGGNFGLTLPLSGTTQTIGVSVIDTGGKAGDAQVRIVPAVNTIPICEIASPADNSSYEVDDPIPFSASAFDGETPSDALTAVLASDLDGVLWEGSPDSGGDIVTPDLTLTGGAHLLTLTVTDARGAIDVCAVHVDVEGCLDLDVDGFTTCDGDCDDANPAAYPGGFEVADGADNDCNGVTDDETALTDDDGDGWTELDGDCDDTDPDVNPDARERWYDGVDDDCDGRDDDQDDDGFLLAEDCDDSDAAVHPYLEEIWYDGVDQDCDGNDDDQDFDGYAVSADCDDLDGGINPGETEIWYDGTDQDCDGADDDRDGDGYLLADDCDDLDAAENPGAAEVWYDGVDQDCDGNDTDQDEDGAPYGVDCDDTDATVNTGEAEIWYDGVDQNCDGNDDDQDTDGFAVADDCDDTNVNIYPGATETWYDGVDQDCAGDDDYDRDADGWQNDDDCDDLDPDQNPGETEHWYDGVDQDCDGNDTDRDEDGYAYTIDCDDLDPDANPGETEVWYNGTDEDCDGADDDRDEDGYGVDEDCDDLDADENPGATEVWYNGVDEDCDGNDTDQDEDGTDYAADCDDTDATVSPYGTEVRDGVDNDCDDLCDEGVMSEGELVITEIMKDPSGTVSDTYGEWFEVYNASAVTISMCGWEIADDDGETVTMLDDVVVLPGEYALFVRDSVTTRNGGLTPDYAWSTAGTLQMGNSGDEVVLYNDGALMDRVAYTTSFPSTAGYSLTLDPDALDAASNDTAANWCRGTSTYFASNYGTPGAANDACP